MRCLHLLAVVLCLGCGLRGVDERVQQAQASLRAIDTFHDFEIARRASASSLAELEGLHGEFPESQQLMLELVRAWVTQTELFALDDLEQSRSHRADDEVIYHRQRVATGYVRARLWALEWLRSRAPDVDLKAPPSELRAVLDADFEAPEDAEPLMWLGHALVGEELVRQQHASFAARVSEIVLEHSIALDESAYFAGAHGLLGRYHGSSEQPDLSESRRHFSRAEALVGRQYLLTQLHRAITYDCQRGDQAAFHTTLDEVLSTNDPATSVRLQNASAKRRAQRWLVAAELWQGCDFSTASEGLAPPR
jgi:hypothetical protein